MTDDLEGSDAWQGKKIQWRHIEPKEPYTVANQIKRTIFATWVNLLLVCVPVGIVLGVVDGPSTATFFVNYAAVIPLYLLVDVATESIEMRVGRIMGALISASVR